MKPVRYFLLKTIRTDCHLKKFLISLVFELVINILNLNLFCLHFNLHLQEAPEYGFNTDPDPQHWAQQWWLFAVGNEVTAISTSPNKEAAAKQIGADR